MVAAVRECDEETGYTAVLGAPLPSQSYSVMSRPKVVNYWCATVGAEVGFAPDDEVDEVRWIPVGDAARHLTYGNDVHSSPRRPRSRPPSRYCAAPHAGPQALGLLRQGRCRAAPDRARAQPEQKGIPSPRCLRHPGGARVERSALRGDRSPVRQVGRSPRPAGAGPHRGVARHHLRRHRAEGSRAGPDPGADRPVLAPARAADDLRRPRRGARHRRGRPEVDAGVGPACPRAASW